MHCVADVTRLTPSANNSLTYLGQAVRGYFIAEIKQAISGYRSPKKDKIARTTTIRPTR